MPCRPVSANFTKHVSCLAFWRRRMCRCGATAADVGCMFGRVVMHPDWSAGCVASLSPGSAPLRQW